MPKVFVPEEKRGNGNGSGKNGRGRWVFRETGACSFIDLFCGIGGFRIAAESHGWKCVFSSDIDEQCQRAYEANFGERPHGDIRKISADQVPDHDILLAGFPCQPFSIIGDRKGFNDTRGTLFFEIARILEAKNPRAFVLENVKLLVGHNNGRTLKRILDVLHDLNYRVSWRVLNALDFGLPQKRERVWIVGTREEAPFEFPAGGVPMKPLSEILETKVPKEFFASEHIKRQRRLAHPNPHPSPAIWHENKGGHISSYPFSCALRAGASYNYLLVDGIRRLTPREMLRLQGFPDSFKIVCDVGQTRKQAGNSLPVPVAKAVLTQLAKALEMKWELVSPTATVRYPLAIKRTNRNAKATIKNREQNQAALSLVSVPL